MSSILITGATGFIGSWLTVSLSATDRYSVRVAVRRRGTATPPGVLTVMVGDLQKRTDWSESLQGVDVVVHAAARVHVIKESLPDPLAEFRRVNVDGTLALARQAASQGVRRFIYLSSIKVNGEETSQGHPFTPSDTPRPKDAYGISKMEAEQGLMEIAGRSAMEIVIIRPPLVYGSGVKANFRSMMSQLNKGIPLPFAAVTTNRRSFVARENLVSLIEVCLEHPSAKNQVFLVSDNDDLSTADLLHRIGVALGKPARLFFMPPAMLRGAAILLGKRGVAQRLLGSLQVDISKTCHMLGWRPVVSVTEALKLTARHFLEHVDS